MRRTTAARSSMAVFDPGKQTSDGATTFKGVWGGRVHLSNTKDDVLP